VEENKEDKKDKEDKEDIKIVWFNSIKGLGNLSYL